MGKSDKHKKARKADFIVRRYLDFSHDVAHNFWFAENEAEAGKRQGDTSERYEYRNRIEM